MNRSALFFASLFMLLALAAAACRPTAATEAPLSPAEYAARLGQGLAVDWAKTRLGMSTYSPMAVQAVRQKGFAHVRIRVKNDLTPAFLHHLDRVLRDTLDAGLIPILAYQARAFKEHPDEATLEQTVAWWETIAARYQHFSPWLSFDLIIEVTGPLNRQPDTLNRFYAQAVAAIRETNPTRIVFIAPRHRSDPDLLPELRIPPQANGYLMAEWHFYASGPSKTRPDKRWTTGTPDEKRLITDKIAHALAWQAETGIPTWVGAWMPGDYNHGNHYTIAEQVRFATFVACQLNAARIPFAVNSDAHFYDRAAQRWIPEMEPVLEAILHPRCDP